MVDALSLRLIDVHVAAAGVAAGALFAVARISELHAGKRLDQPARRLELAVVPPEVEVAW